MDAPAGRNGTGFFLARDMLDSAPERSRSTGVLGRDTLPSLREGGLSYRDAIGFAGDWGYDRIVGIDRLSFNSWALVVVGSLRRAVMEGLDARSRRRGVEGGSECIEDGVVGVGMPGMLLIEDCEE